jgi:hypothetical protein
MKRLKLPDLDILKFLFSYETSSGKLLWRNVTSTYQNKSIGKEAGTKNSGKYLRVKILGKSYLVHRVIWKIYYNEEPPDIIDHIDGDCLNNRIENLRECSHGQNMANSTLTTSKSGFKGVYPVKGSQSLYKVIVAGNYLGCYKSKEEAKKVYEREAEKLWGVFARFT